MTKLDGERCALAALLAGSLMLATLLDDSVLPVYILLSLTAIVTVGVSLLMGHAGQVSLGHGAFYATGAYTAGLLAVHGVPSLLALLVAPLAAAAIAALAGMPLLLLRGHHLAFATLATHLIFLSLVGEMTALGGDVGLRGIPPLGVAGYVLDSARAYAYVSCLALFGVVVVTRNLLASRPGRALHALSSSEIAAASSGVPVPRYKLAVFALSAAFAGLAGGVYAFFMGYLAPGSFPVMLSIEYVVMAAVGGFGRVSGALAGSALVFLLVHGLSRAATMSGMPSSAPIVLSYAVYAVLLAAAMLFLPGGVMSMLDRLVARLRRRPKPTTGRNLLMLSGVSSSDRPSHEEPRSVP
jgi:branched-chain amino acid transport system permease protein